MVTTKRTTVEELERDGGPDGLWELIDGELFEVTPAGGEASSVGAMIGYFLTSHVRANRLGQVYGADGGFVPFPDRETLCAPAVAFVRTERVPPPPEHDRFLRLAPDLAVEVVSPYDRPGEVAAKAAMWLDAGVRLLWVVDPRARTVAVHVPNQAARVLGMGDDLDGGDVLPDFRVPVAELFA